MREEETLVSCCYYWVVVAAADVLGKGSFIFFKLPLLWYIFFLKRKDKRDTSTEVIVHWEQLSNMHYANLLWGITKKLKTGFCL